MSSASEIYRIALKPAIVDKYKGIDYTDDLFLSRKDIEHELLSRKIYSGENLITESRSIILMRSNELLLNAADGNLKPESSISLNYESLRKFMIEMYTSCHRCGKSIILEESDGSMLCRDCDRDLAEYHNLITRTHNIEEIEI